jgi:hypothetical protein
LENLFVAYYIIFNFRFISFDLLGDI